MGFYGASRNNKIQLDHEFLHGPRKCGSQGMERNIFYLILKSSYRTSSNPRWGIELEMSASQ